MLLTVTDGGGRQAVRSAPVWSTGPAPGTPLTVVNGDVLITNAWVAANGNTLDRHWIRGHVVMTASTPVTISRSIISGRPFTGSPPRTAIVYARSTSTPATALLHLIDCEIYPVQPHVDIVCLSGERIGQVIRCNIHGGSDLVNYWGSQVQIEDSWLHGFSFWANDPKHADDTAHPGWSHNDAVQSNGCTGGYVRRTLIDMRADPGFGDYATLAVQFPGGAWGSAIMLTGSTAPIVGMEVSDCWLGYGQAPIAMPRQAGGAFENFQCSWEVTRNVFWQRPDPYGASDYQLIRWGAQKGPVPASVHHNTFVDHQSAPPHLRGITLPGAVLVGSGASGQYIVRVT